MLKRVSIQNFKSLKDVTLDLQKVNLLIGPNNSGKTNFLKALEVINSLNETNNYFDENYCFRKNFLNTPSLYFVVNSSLPWSGEEDYDHYKISSIAEKRFLSEKAILKIGTGSNQEINKLPDDFHEAHIEEGSTIHLKNIQYELQNVRVYTINAFELSTAYPLLPGNELVSPNASNLVAFLDGIRDKFPDNFFSIQDSLSKCLTEFSQIRFDNIEPDAGQKNIYGDKTFKKLGLYNHKQKITYWADELSEGTLYFLALLCIINQPNPPKLLLLEEPEKGIHPRRIREVMDFVRRLASEKDIQVIMTTHSPLLLDEFAESPQSVFVFDKDDEGATIVRNLQWDVIEPANQENERLGIPPVPYTEALGEYWTIGFLGGIPHEAA